MTAFMPGDNLPDKVGAKVDLAQNAATGPDAEARMRRLTQDRRPTTASSTGSWVNWSNAADVLGQPFDMVRIPIAKLEQMRRDPMLAFGLTFVKVPLVRAPWYIKCSDPRIAAAVTEALKRIYGRFIMAYCNSFDYGFSPMVKRFELESPDWTYEDKVAGRELPVWDSTAKMLVWKPFTALNPRTCTPHWNSKGDFNGIDFNSSGNGMSPFFNSASSAFPSRAESAPRQADIPVDWSLWATNDKDSVFGSYWGYPRIGYAYRYWWAYWYRFGLADRAFERWADPPILAYHPADIGVDEDGNPLDLPGEALSVAEQLRSGANVSMPSTVVTGFDDRQTNVREWALEQMESKADFDALNQVFEYLDVQKLRAVMVPEQALVEGKGGTSSRNVAATFGDVFQESQAVVKQEIDDQLNRYVIPQFVKLNFGEDAPRAEIVTHGFDAVDVETMREIVRLLGQENKFTTVDLRSVLERLGIPQISLSQEQATKEAADANIQNVEPESDAAGFSEGKAFKGRDRIVLSHFEDLIKVIFSDEVTEPTYDLDSECFMVPVGMELEDVKKWVFKKKEEHIEPIRTELAESDVKVQMAAWDAIIHATEKLYSQPQVRPPDIHVHIEKGKSANLGGWEYTTDEEGRITRAVPIEKEEDDGEEPETA